VAELSWANYSLNQYFIVFILIPIHAIINSRNHSLSFSPIKSFHVGILKKTQLSSTFVPLKKAFLKIGANGSI